MKSFDSNDSMNSMGIMDRTGGIGQARENGAADPAQAAVPAGDGAGQIPAAAPAETDMDTKKVLLLSSAHLSSDINAGALPAVIPFLRDAYSLSYQATGGIMFAYSLLAAIMQPFFGLLSDRFKKPWPAALGVLLAGTGLALTGLVESYWGVLVAVSICGLGSAIFHPTGARFANLIGGSRKAFALSIFSTGGNIGFVLGPLAAAALMTLYGLSGTLFFGLLALMTAFALVLSISRIGKVEARPAEICEGGVCRPLPNNWTQFNRLTVSIVARTIVVSSIQAYLPLYLVHAFGQSKAQGAIAVTLFGLVGVLSNIAGGWLSDRWGRGRILHFSFLPLAPALIVFSMTDSQVLAYAMLVILAFSLYFGFSAMVVLGQQFLARNMGFASGITLGLSTAVGGICAPLLGWVGDNWGLAASFQVMAVLAVLATITCFFIDPEANAPRPAGATV